MLIIQGFDGLGPEQRGASVALGNFDGLHLGHRALIVELTDICKQKGLRSVVFTFKNDPRGLTCAAGARPRIISEEKKYQLLRECGVETVVTIEFNDYYRKLLEYL